MFKTGVWRRLFPVQVTPLPSEAAAVDVITKANEWIDDLFTNMHEAQERARTERNRYEANP